MSVGLLSAGGTDVAGTEVSVGCLTFAEGGTGVDTGGSVGGGGGAEVSVGAGAGVSVGGTSVGGTDVSVGGTDVLVGGTGVAVSGGSGVFVAGGMDTGVSVEAGILVGGTDVMVGIEAGEMPGGFPLGFLVGIPGSTDRWIINASTSSTAVPGFANVILIYLAFTGLNCARIVSGPETTPLKPASCEL